MQPEIYVADFLELDGDHGVYVIPLDALLSKAAATKVRRELSSGMRSIELPADDGRPYPLRAAVNEMRQFYPGNRLELVTLRMNMVGARLSMPGYLDCTDWTLHETEAEARYYLSETYGEDDEV